MNSDSGSCTFDFIVADKSQELLTSLTPFLIVIIAVIGLTQCAVTWLSYQLFQEFGWKIYKKIGADPNMKSKFTFESFEIKHKRGGYILTINFASHVPCLPDLPGVD